MKKISKLFPSIARVNLNINIKKFLEQLEGKVLDIGAGCSPYKHKINYTDYQTMDIDSKNNPDVIANIHTLNIEDSFDSVIITEVLEHCENPQQVINKIYDVLKPDGVCLLSTRFIHPYHPSPLDCFRFTKDSLDYLFSKFKKVEIYPIGNRFLCVWELISHGYLFYGLRLFNYPLALLFNFKSDIFPLGYIVLAKKGE